MPLLEVGHLAVEFSTPRGTVRALDDVSLRIDEGAVLAVVGESGSGKSTTAMSVIGLLPRRRARIVGGSIRFQGEELIGADARRLDEIRGPGIGTVFQDALTSFDPSFTIGDQIDETLRRHLRLPRKAARARTLELLDEVRLPDPERAARSYPHQLSGGMRQRALIALALSCDPRLLIADEPTTALDVTIQAEILALLGRLRRERGMGVMLITHDMGVAAQTADEIAVMYAGQIVEIGPTAAVLSDPAHAYTQALLGARPSLDDPDARRGRLTAIPGSPPDLTRPPGGDRFAARIDPSEAAPEGTPPPAFVEIGPRHVARCGSVVA